MSITMYLSCMKASASCFDERSLVSDWYSTSHSRKRAFFPILLSGFLAGYFGSFTAIELLYRTRLRAPHVKHGVSNFFWRPLYWALALAVGVKDSRKTKRVSFSSGPRTTERGNANGVSELKKEKERYQLLVQVLKNLFWIIVELFTRSFSH